MTYRCGLRQKTAPIAILSIFERLFDKTRQNRERISPERTIVQRAVFRTCTAEKRDFNGPPDKIEHAFNAPPIVFNITYIIALVGFVGHSDITNITQRATRTRGMFYSLLNRKNPISIQIRLNVLKLYIFLNFTSGETSWASYFLLTRRNRIRSASQYINYHGFA